MPLSRIEREVGRIERKDREYLYFSDKKKRIYLGHKDKPQIENIRKAIDLQRGRIERIIDEKRKIESLLPRNVEPLDSRPLAYKMIVFDLDDIIYYQESWAVFNDQKRHIASTWERVFRNLEPPMGNVYEVIEQRYLGGSIKDSNEFIDSLCQMLSAYGLRKDKFEKLINDQKINLGAFDLLKELRKNNVVTVAVTGSFEALAERANKELGGIDHISSFCKLNFDPRGLLGSWELNPDFNDKLGYIESLAKQHEIPLKECAYIGNEADNVEVFKKIGLAIAFNCKNYRLLEVADKVIVGSVDVRDVLPHLRTARQK